MKVDFSPLAEVGRFYKGALGDVSPELSVHMRTMADLYLQFDGQEFDTDILKPQGKLELQRRLAELTSNLLAAGKGSGARLDAVTGIEASPRILEMMEPFIQGTMSEGLRQYVVAYKQERECLRLFGKIVKIFEEVSAS